MMHSQLHRALRPASLALRLVVALALVASSSAATFGPKDKTLDIYWIDTEGGAATLIVTPRGESVLVDSGNPGERDLGRIVHVVKQVAALKQIDHHIITHWHGDHFGSTEALAEKIPIARYYDHGPSVEGDNFEEKFGWYLKLSDSKRTILQPGDEITLTGETGVPPLRLVCVVSAGKVLPNPDGTQPAEHCANHPAKPEDKSDNAQSIGFKLSFGEFDFLDLGDLTWNVEHRLACPENKVGVVDVYQTDHHGLAVSNNPALVHAVQARVAVMNNGPRKGGELPVVETLRSSPGLEAIFQVHRNVRTSEKDNAPREFIANDAEKCDGDYVWLKVAPDAKSYTVAAGKDGKPKKYETK